ncbi:MAG: J domain-containing protein [Ignavibacteria bacterium]|nr:J domain-containing protein [Ignavibacteria bacterium]
MSQIFNRIKNILSSHGQDGPTGTEWADELINSDDEELRRAINELGGDSQTGRSAGGDSAKSNAGANTRSKSSFDSGPASNQSFPEYVTRAANVLGVPATASAAEVKKAYRAQVSKWHPDMFVQDGTAQQAEANKRTQEINAAYIIMKQFSQLR